LVFSEALRAWQYASPAKRSKSGQRLALRDLRQAILSSNIGVLTLDVRDLQCFNDTLKVGLLVFLELRLEIGG